MNRSSRGMSVVELMVSALLMGLTMAAVGELVVMNTYSATRLTNATDGQYGCSRAIRRIGEDVRMASAIVASQCTPQILVLQQPVCLNDPTSNLNGFPLLTASQNQTACVDTITYQVVADPVNVNVYQLQLTRVPGVPGYPTSTKPALQQQVVLTGLVGPSLNGQSGPPSVFQYLSSSNQLNFPTSPPSPGTTTVGVFVDLEVQSPSSGLGVGVRHSGAHIETYLKCAVSAKQTNQ